MAETTRPTAPLRTDVPSVSRLRSLARPGFAVKPFMKTVTPFEIGAIIGLLVLVTAVTLLYSFVILPDQVRFVQMSGQVSDNDRKIAELTGQVADPTNLTTSFQAVHDSLNGFRTATLEDRMHGRIAIIDRVGALTRETGVRLASPVSFLSSELDARMKSGATGDSGAAAQGKVRPGTKENPIATYPSMKMTFSITGSYPQLRAFISKFEAGKQFVVIDSVGLNAEESPDADSPRGGRGAAPAGGPSPVTLDIALTAYFRPDGVELVPAAAPIPAPVPVQ